jgi:hypothetical protein
MNKLLLACLILAPAAQAQEVSCPKFYPWQDTVLTEVPYRHVGKGVVPKQELSGASAMGSPYNAPHPPIEFQGSTEKKLKGGVDLAMPTLTKYFVCRYSGGVTWWEELKHDPKKVNGCTMKIRDKVGSDPMDISFACK